MGLCCRRVCDARSNNWLIKVYKGSKPGRADNLYQQSLDFTNSTNGVNFGILFIIMRRIFV